MSKYEAPNPIESESQRAIQGDPELSNLQSQIELAVAAGDSESVQELTDELRAKLKERHGLEL